jgi:hypothetical protein
MDWKVKGRTCLKELRVRCQQEKLWLKIFGVRSVLCRYCMWDNSELWPLWGRIYVCECSASSTSLDNTSKLWFIRDIARRQHIGMLQWGCHVLLSDSFDAHVITSSTCTFTCLPVGAPLHNALRQYLQNTRSFWDVEWDYQPTEIISINSGVPRGGSNLPPTPPPKFRSWAKFRDPWKINP